MLKQNVLYENGGLELFQRIGDNTLRFPRRAAVAGILMVALLAFELFNFDTTRYALANLLGPVSFIGFRWASILAIAFCAIDFAGLVRMFTPESDAGHPKEVWYLMGAWLLGATMNALMTWWAVSLTLLSHDFGNEVLSRGQLLQIVPIFVATLVWLTRILFIGALTVTGGQLLHGEKEEQQTHGARASRKSLPVGVPLTETLARGVGLRQREAEPALVSHRGVSYMSDELPAFLRRRPADATAELEESRVSAPEIRSEPAEPRESSIRASQQRLVQDTDEPEPRKAPQRPVTNGRVRQRPPMPGANGFHARSRGRN